MKNKSPQFKMNKFKISICIPTYNRAEYLDQLLKSIYYQDESKYCEIVVSDNASVDGTELVIEKYRSNGNVTYHKNSQNIGPDENYLKSVSLASADYCWLMGSDDIIIPGSLKLILDVLESNNDLTGLSINQLYLNSDISEVPQVVPFLSFENNAPILLNNFHEICKQISHYFGYLSGQIINKSIWDQQILQGKYRFYLNSYVHVFVILGMVKNYPKWLILPSKCVGYRSGNDSFLTSGIVNRGIIDVVGYGQIYNYFAGESIMMNIYCNSVILRKFIMGHLIRAKLANATRIELIKFVLTILKFNYLNPYFYFVILPLTLLPKIFINILRRVYRATARKKKLINHLEYSDILNEINILLSVK